MGIADDTLQSKQTAHILDLICEGEIKGLVNGNQSVYVDGTPLQNSEGDDNFSGYTVAFRNGTRDQSYIPGFPESESMVSVNTEVTKALPVVRTITTEHVNELYITLATPRLYAQNASNGSVKGSSIGYTIEVKPAGGVYEKVVIDYAKVKGNSADADKIEVTVKWTGSAAAGSQSATYAVDAKAEGGDWVEFDRVTVTGSTKSVTKAPKGSTTHIFYSNKQLYSFRARLIDSPGFTLGTPTYYSLTATTEGLISGKASSTYSRSHTIPLAGSAPWNVRVTKTTDDTTTLIQRDLFWYSTTEVIHAKLRYPNSVVAGITIDSSLFGSIPSRAYDLYGLLVKVPSNYDPVTKTYSGIWDGTFKAEREWTDNPAWCYYDLATSKRYGLGEFVSEAQIDKATLYTIGKYCDETVPDGFGGMEPRFSCNLYLQTREDAFRILTDMAALFAGMLFWSSGGLSCTQDRPGDAIYQFTNANVVDGEFKYSGSSRSVRHTTALISYNDPDDKFARKVEYVEDEDGIAKYGVRQIEMAAIGCSSRGQAHRLGKRILLTERYLTEVVTFKTGLEGAVCYPGAVFDVMDNVRAGKRMGGRVSSATTSAITLDKEVTIEAGVSYTLSIISQSGIPSSVGIVNVPGTTRVLSFTVPITNVPNSQSVWVLSSSALQAQQFKTTGVKQDGVDYEVTALAYNVSKYAAIEQGLSFQLPTTSVIKSASFIEAPSNVVIAEVPILTGQSTLDRAMTVSFDPTPSMDVFLNYLINWKYEEGNWDSVMSAVPSVTIGPIVPANVEVQVYAISKTGARSLPSGASATLFGKVSPPSNVMNLSAQNQDGIVTMKWDRVYDIDIDGYELRYTNVGGREWELGTRISSVTWGTQMTTAAIPPGTWTFMIKARDTSGNQSSVPAYADCKVVNPNSVISSWDAAEGVVTLTVDGMALSPLDRAWVPLSLLATAAAGGWATFDEFIPSPPAYCAISGPELTCGFPGNSRVYATSLSAWPTGYLGNDPDISMSHDSSPYEPWTVGYSYATDYVFKAEMRVETGLSAIKKFVPALDLPTRVETGPAVSVPATGLAVAYSSRFARLPAVTATASGVVGLQAVVTSQDVNGFVVKVFNTSNAAVAGTVNWTAQGT